MRLPVPLLALAPLAACSPTVEDRWPDGSAGADDTAAEDPTDALYDPDHLLEVRLEIDPDDWDALRHQSRNLMEMITGDCLDGPFESPYTWFPASVEIDGVDMPEVAVRKKGLIGSDDPDRPSLKVKFSAYDDDLRFHGADRITLNNGRQDPSRLNQCLGYGVFRSAGLPAPRCNFAHVTVNGEDMGVYVNVEPVKEPFLARNFGDDSGNLYEGTLSDFREGWTGTFDKKTNEDDPDRSDLDAVVAALDVADEDLEESLDAVVDLDAFYRFWAMEALLVHWDGYSGNTNNFFVYDDPSDGRLRFVPWGADALFDASPLADSGLPTSVMTSAVIPWRLYGWEPSRDTYVATLLDLLDAVWDEDALLAEVDRMEALVGPRALDPDAQAEAVDGIRDFVETRRATIEDELADGPVDPDAVADPPPDDPCLVEIGSVEATFETTWGTLDGDWWSAGTADTSIVIEGVTYPAQATGAAAGDYDDGAIVLIATLLDATTGLYPYVLLDPDAVRTGAEVPVDWGVAKGYLGYTTADIDWAVAAYLYEGTLTFDEAGTDAGDPVRGTLRVGIWGSGG